VPLAEDAVLGGRRPAHYELTVTGALGPVLRGALAPCDVTLVEVHTILRTAVREGTDLVDVVETLQRAGLEIADVTVLTCPSSPSSPGRAPRQDADMTAPTGSTGDTSRSALPQV
jgi:hypothetical protein